MVLKKAVTKKTITQKSIDEKSSSALFCAGLDAVCKTKKKGRCLGPEDIALFAELKKNHPRYPEAVAHIADCAHCCRRARNTFAALNEGLANAPEHFMRKLFLHISKHPHAGGGSLIHGIKRLLHIQSRHSDQ